MDFLVSSHQFNKGWYIHPSEDLEPLNKEVSGSEADDFCNCKHSKKQKKKLHLSSGNPIRSVQAQKTLKQEKTLRFRGSISAWVYYIRLQISRHQRMKSYNFQKEMLPLLFHISQILTIIIERIQQNSQIKEVLTSLATVFLISSSSQVSHRVSAYQEVRQVVCGYKAMKINTIKTFYLDNLFCTCRTECLLCTSTSLQGYGGLKNLWLACDGACCQLPHSLTSQTNTDCQLSQFFPKYPSIHPSIPVLPWLVLALVKSSLKPLQGPFIWTSCKLPFL